jgi:tetratricopeptide (TPR) repeat protein
MMNFRRSNAFRRAAVPPNPRVCLRIAALLLIGLSSMPASAQLGRPEGLYYKSWGIVIGIDEYQVAPKLTGMVADAKMFAEQLRTLGFEDIVEVYNTDATLRRFQWILNEYLLRKVGRQDRVVLFFSGHTGSAPDVRSKDIGYLVPWDAHIANSTKAISLDQLKEFSQRVMAKHVLFVINAPISGWDVTPPQQLSLEGRLTPEEDTDKRAIQLYAAAKPGEPLTTRNGAGLFAQAFVAGLQGAADANHNGWIMASELGDYVAQQVEEASGGRQHPQFVRLSGDGNAIWREGKASAFRSGPEPKTGAERAAAAQSEYDKAFSILQQQRSTQEALERLNQAIEYNPAFGEAYILKSYLYLEYLQNLDEALAAGKTAVQRAPSNPDSHYTLGLVLQRRGSFPEAEQAMLQALALRPTYADVHLSLGDLYAEDLKDRQKATAAYRRYLENGGSDKRAVEYLQKAGSPSPPPAQQP